MNNKNISVGVKVAWITTFGVILAAIIGGVFLIYTPKDKVEKSNIIAKDSSSISIDNRKIEVNRDYIQAKDVTIKNENKVVYQKFNDTTKKGKNIQQTMNNSPSSVQIAGEINGDVNVNINANRTLNERSKDELLLGLRKNPCNFQIGTLGMGGEPYEFGDELYAIVKASKCPVAGPFHGIGFEPFNGVKILYSVSPLPLESVKVIEKVFKLSNIKYLLIPDANQPENTIYLFVGFKK